MKLRKVTMDDARLLFEWRNEPHTRAMSYNSEPIPWRSHYDWLKAKLADYKCRMWIAEVDNVPVGMVRLERKYGSEEISLMVDSRFRNKGMAKQIVKKAITRALTVAIFANIKPENKASHAVFLKLGFRQINKDTYMLSPLC